MKLRYALLICTALALPVFIATGMAYWAGKIRQDAPEGKAQAMRGMSSLPQSLPSLGAGRDLQLEEENATQP